MRAKMLAALLAATSTCSIICGPGCDFLVPGECRGDGGLYGPCVDHGCAADLTCFSGVSGEMCVRSSAPTDDDVTCASIIGGLVIETEPKFYGAWLIRCENDGDCNTGAICDETNRACMHPYHVYNVKPPPGFDLGPCDDGSCGYPENECLVASDGAGDICWNPERPEQLVPCSAVEDGCPNGQVCSVADFTCVWPAG